MKTKLFTIISALLLLVTVYGSRGYSAVSGAVSGTGPSADLSLERISTEDEDDFAAPAFHEVRTHVIGPASRHPMRAFNVNHFEFEKAAKTVPDCETLAKSDPCPRDMVFVCSKFFRTATCVDRDLYNDRRTGKPKGNMNLADCEQACKAEDKRLPTNNEWQVACTGTKPEACLTYTGEYPPLRYSKVPGHACQRTGPYNDPCMTSPDLVALLPPVPKACVSDAGVRGCVGTFEQWVSHAFVAHQFYRFNGGMYDLSASAVNYVTPGHNSSYRHYAGGCRCASDPR